MYNLFENLWISDNINKEVFGLILINIIPINYTIPRVMLNSTII